MFNIVVQVVTLALTIIYVCFSYLAITSLFSKDKRTKYEFLLDEMRKKSLMPLAEFEYRREEEVEYRVLEYAHSEHRSYLRAYILLGLLYIDSIIFSYTHARVTENVLVATYLWVSMIPAVWLLYYLVSEWFAAIDRERLDTPNYQHTLKEIAANVANVFLTIGMILITLQL